MQLAVKNYVIQTKVMGTPQLRFGALGERHLNCHAVVPTRNKTKLLQIQM